MNLMLCLLGLVFTLSETKKQLGEMETGVIKEGGGQAGVKCE